MTNIHEYLQQAIDQNDPSSFLDYREFIASLYKTIKQNQKKYSWIQMSGDLGLSRSNVLHLIVRGKRPLTEKAGQKMISSLHITGKQKKYLTILIKWQNCRKEEERSSLFKELMSLKTKLIPEKSRNVLEFFSEWYHTAIYQMTWLDHFQYDSKWISNQLEPTVRPDQVRKSIQLLKSLGLFKEEDGTLKPTHEKITTGDEINSIAVIRYHNKLIEMGRESITRVKEDSRDISAVTVSIAPEQIPKMKEAISEFRKKLMAIEDQCQSANCVYQMNIQLFPLTSPPEES